MYIPNAQSILATGMALCGAVTKTGKTVTKGKILDYALETCIDKDGNQRCSSPFLVSKDSCYHLSWTSEGAFSHTTVEVRDSGSNEIVYYRDTDGEWNPGKGELVYLDFKPKVFNTGNSTIEYKVVAC